MTFSINTVSELQNKTLREFERAKINLVFGIPLGLGKFVGRRRRFLMNLKLFSLIDVALDSSDLIFESQIRAGLSFCEKYREILD